MGVDTLQGLITALIQPKEPPRMCSLLKESLRPVLQPLCMEVLGPLAELVDLLKHI